MDRLISEQKAIEAINDYWGEMETPTIDGYINAIKSIPSVKPKMGHWIYDRTRDWDGECKYECSKCGMGSDVDYAYCMRCGARMECEQNG